MKDAVEIINRKVERKLNTNDERKQNLNKTSI